MQLEFARPVAPFTLDPLAYAVIDATGRIILLTRSEFRILHLLMLIKVYISRLRRKIEPDARYPRHIITVRGQGYSFHH
jgi:DNA-binding response OmpR family regulator